MKFIKTLSILSVTALALSGCKQSTSSASDGQTVVLFEGVTKTVTLGTSADYPPFEYKRQGEFVGIDIEIAHAIAKKLGYTLEIADMDFGSLIGAVKSGRVDFVLSALTATPERLKSIDFSDTYYQAEIAAIYKEGQAYNKPEDFENKKIGVQLGSIMEIYIKKIAMDHPNVTIKPLNKNPELIQELKLGRIDAVLLEEAQAVEFSQKNPGLAFNPIPNTGEGYAIGFKKGSPLKDEFNRVLRQLKSDGTLAKIKAHWIQKSSNDQ